MNQDVKQNNVRTSRATRGAIAHTKKLKLLSRLSEQLTETISLPVIVDREKREREAAAVLRACDRAASAFERRTDSAETMRYMRDERCGKLCLTEVTE